MWTVDFSFDGAKITLSINNITKMKIGLGKKFRPN